MDFAASVILPDKSYVYDSRKAEIKEWLEKVQKHFKNAPQCEGLTLVIACDQTSY